MKMRRARLSRTPTTPPTCALPARPARPQAPDGFNDFQENEDMISFHLAAIHGQLQQAYLGLALAAASGRAFISPKARAAHGPGLRAGLLCMLISRRSGRSICRLAG